MLCVVCRGWERPFIKQFYPNSRVCLDDIRREHKTTSR